MTTEAADDRPMRAWLVALDDARLRVRLARRDVERRAAELQVRIAEQAIAASEVSP